MRSVVLCYHGVGSCDATKDPHNLFVSPARFERQIAYLAAKRTVVELSRIVDGSAPRGSVAVTFDDGYRNNLSVAAPIMARHSIPATIFVPTAFLGDRNRWIDPTPCDVDILSKEELIRCAERGLSIQSHGHAHIDCSDSPDRNIESDLASSIDVLTEILGTRPRYLAYPYGRDSETARRIARAAGFDAAFTLDQLGRDRFAWERVQVTPLDGDRMFAFKTSGRYLAVRRSAAASVGYRALKPIVRGALRRR